MPIPQLSNFTRRRPDNVVAGQPRYVNTLEITEYTRSSPLSPTSGPIAIGVAVAFTGNVVGRNRLREVQAVDTPAYTFVAEDFAGFTAQVHEDNLDRLGSVPSLHDPARISDYANTFRYDPANMQGFLVPRWTFKSIWVRTDLTVAPALGVDVQILPDGRVSDAGGVAVPGVVFTGDVVTGWDGDQYATVNIVTPVAA